MAVVIADQYNMVYHPTTELNGTERKVPVSNTKVVHRPYRSRPVVGTIIPSMLAAFAGTSILSDDR